MTFRPTQKFVKGQTILSEGQQGDRAYRIIAGEVIICRKSQSGNRVPIAKLGIGEMFGEMYLFEEDKTRTASAIAASADVMVEIYFHDEITEMLNQLSPYARKIFSGLSRRLQKTSGQYAQMLPSKSVTQLPDGTLKQNGSLIQPNQQFLL